jgi:ATP-dependent Clp protease, protease subunit
MIIGNIYITGQIGSNEDSKGVELLDIVTQVKKNEGAEMLNIHINSQGGSVQTGRIIAEYISKLPNAVTIAEGLCGSIATEIHLSRPLAQRKIIAGTEYFIHNPLLQNVSGNAEELERAAAAVRPYEKEMIQMYIKATGADKASIEGLMKAATSLTDEECKTLGFVSEVIAKTELKAVAFYNKEEIKKENKNSIDMSKIIAELKEGFKNIKAELGIKPEVKAITLVTDNGELTYASEGDLPEVGEVVMIGEAVAPEGAYADEIGNVINVVGEEGIVESIVLFEEEAPEEDTVEALKAKLVQANEAHAAEIAEIKESFTTQMNALKVEIGSNFIPKAEKKVFAKKIVKKPLTMREKVAARKEELKKA